MTKSKQRRKPCKLGIEDFKTVMQLGLTQKEGAQYLDICLSSFKRQFSKTALKWPSLSELRSHKHHRELRKKLGRMVDMLDVELTRSEEVSNVTAVAAGVVTQAVCQRRPSNVDRTNPFSNPSITGSLFSGDSFEGALQNAIGSDTDSFISSTEGISIDNFLKDSTFLNDSKKLKQQVFPQVPINLSRRPEPSIMRAPFLGDISLINGPWVLNSQYYTDNNIGLVVFDSNLNVLACNQLYHHITGYSMSDMLPSFSHVEKVMLRVYDADFYRKIYRRMLANINFMCVQNTWVTKDQRHVFLKVTYRRFQSHPSAPHLGYFEVEPLTKALPAFTIGETVVHKGPPSSLLEDHIQSFQILDSNVPKKDDEQDDDETLVP